MTFHFESVLKYLFNHPIFRAASKTFRLCNCNPPSVLRASTMSLLNFGGFEFQIKFEKMDSSLENICWEGVGRDRSI